MVRRPTRIATTVQFERSVRQAGFDTYLLPELPSLDFNRRLEQRISDGQVYRPFLEKNDIDLVLDFNTETLTLVPSDACPGEFSLTTAALGIPYVACYVDPITSTMANVDWADHWHLLESNTWIKWIFELAHGEELIKLGVPNVIVMPMAIADGDFDTGPLPEPDPGPVVAFMGHPASSWFKSQTAIQPAHLFAGLTAAAVRADMPDMPFHKIYYDLYGFDEPPRPEEDRPTRARKAQAYYSRKFIYNAYLAIKQCDRFAHFLQRRVGDNFELIGDLWGTNYGLKHTPHILDKNQLHERMRRVPICLNLMKGNIESGLTSRHFEVTAYGGFLLTYPTPELDECFKIGEECEVFRDEQELLEKISYYLSHPKERLEIAAAGQRRTLNEHLYSHRVAKLVELLTSTGTLPKAGVSATEPRTMPADAARCRIAVNSAPDPKVTATNPSDSSAFRGLVASDGQESPGELRDSGTASK